VISELKILLDGCVLFTQSLFSDFFMDTVCKQLSVIPL